MRVACTFKSNRQCLDFILKAIENTNYKPGEMFIALDVASSEFLKYQYNLQSENKLLSSDELIEYYGELIKNYPIISIEDGLDENDWDG